MTMTRYIDADPLKIALYYDVSKGTYGEFMDGSEVSYTDKEILKLIDEQPTIDAVPVKHGKWTHYKDEHTCSKCGETVTGGWDEDYDYCPNCGARMDKDECTN